MQRCAFRLDDITPDMNWDNFEALKQLFNKYHIAPLLGVVPDSKDPHLCVSTPREDFWDIMHSLKQEGWSISQHGYCHVYETEDAGLLGINPFSEFAGLPYEEQYDKLKKGKEILKTHNLDTDIFMAPGHTYDKNTLKALVQNGFQFVTDGYSEKPYKKMGLTFIPSRMSGPGKIKGVDTVCLHLNGMSAEQIRQLDKFMEQNQDKVCNFSDLLVLNPEKNRNFITFCQEKRNLYVRQIKKTVAENSALTMYLQKTTSESKGKKICKRIVMAPMLIVYFIKDSVADGKKQGS